MNFYYLLYYKVYVVLELFNKWLRNSIIEWSALFFLSAFEIVNLVTILGLIELETDYKFNWLTEIEGKLVSGLIIIINYFILLHNGRYKKIVKHYKKNYKSSHDFMVIGYITLTIILFMTVANRSRDKVKSEQMEPWMKEIRNVEKEKN